MEILPLRLVQEFLMASALSAMALTHCTNRYCSLQFRRE
jgi:hypothetical protein